MLGLLLLALAATQSGPPAPDQTAAMSETRLLVSSPRADSPALRRLRESLGASVVADTSTDAQVWAVPEGQVSAAFRALAASRDVSAVDYAGEDFRTLLIGVDPDTLTLPEQQQLDELRSWPGVAEVQVQRPRRGALSTNLLTHGFGRPEGLAADGSFLFDLPGRDGAIAATVSAGSGRDPAAWTGEVSAGPDEAGPDIALGEALFRATGSDITGNLTVGGDSYVISSLGNRGLNAVFRVDPTSLPPDHLDRGFGGVEPSATAEREAAAASPPVRGPTVVTVGVAYTPAAMSRLSAAGGDMLDIIERWMAETNHGLQRSGATFSLQLAGTRRLLQPETTMKPDVRALMGRDDGRWDDIHAWRDATRSDLVVVIVSVTSTECGEAGAIPGAASQAFAVVSLNCAMATYTFGHEIGHLLGAMHVNDTKTTTTPSFARGYVHDQDWRTVMAEVEACAGCGRINHWANPDIVYRGVPSGVRGRNHDIRALNENALTASSFR